MPERGPSFFSSYSKEDRRSQARVPFSFEAEDSVISGRASGCASRRNTRFLLAPVHRVLMNVSEMVGQALRAFFETEW